MRKTKLLWFVGAFLCICSMLLFYPKNDCSSENSSWDDILLSILSSLPESPEVVYNAGSSGIGWNGLLLFPEYGESDKSPTEEQLKAGKGVGSILWSTKSGGPRHIRGDLTPPSEEDPEVIAWRFLEEKKALYGIENPQEDLRIKIRIDGKYATTIHFRQMYKGVPVANGSLVVSILPNGVIHAISGVYYPDVEIDAEPKISAEEAFNTAGQHWYEFSIHTSIDEYIVQNMYSAPRGQLKIQLTARKHYLLWCFDILHWNIYIDAHKGIIRKAYYLAPNSTGSEMPGGNIEVAPKSLHFGVNATADYPAKEIVIGNTKSRTLVIRDIVLQEGPFTIEGPLLPLPFPILKGEEAVISIGFSPSKKGKETGRLSIESTADPVVEVLLTGGGAPSHSTSIEDKSYFHYAFSPYGSLPSFLSPYGDGSWTGPFLYEPYEPSPASTNQGFLGLGRDYLFPWNNFNYPQKNFSFNFLYLPSDNFFNYSFYPTSEHYNYFSNDLF